jgi:RimJ/RimL family protein N-acetyltransferase
MLKEVREIKKSDVNFIVNYFHNSTPEFLIGMGADPKKLPEKVKWENLLFEEINKTLRDKKFYYIIWTIDKKPIGHSNINRIEFGKSAFMHLHLWNIDNRQKGSGEYFIKKTIPYYFENFELEELYCEPYAKNPAPNRILKKTGFELVKTYETTPGWINFRQLVKKWRLSKNKFENIKGAYNDE